MDHTGTVSRQHRIDVLGVLVDNHTLASAVDAAMALVEQDGPSQVVTPNAEMLVNARQSPELLRVLQGAAMVIADGIGVVKAADILGRPLKGRVAGADLAEALLPRLEESGKVLFLYGGQPGVAEGAAAKLRERYPRLAIHTAHGFLPAGDAAPLIAETGADVVYVGLGSPRQEFWIRDHGAATGAKLLIGLGGTIDVFAGKKPRAPQWIQRLGFEWLYQTIRDPRRIKRVWKSRRILAYARWQRHLEK